MRGKKDDLAGYKPMTWEKDSKLSKDEQETVESQRKDLWRGGVRTEPLLIRMAFEFAAVIHMSRAEK